MYEFSLGRAKARKLGITVDEDKLAKFSTNMQAIPISDLRADKVLCHYFEDFALVFTPSNYSIKGRLLMAFHFLFRRKL